MVKVFAVWGEFILIYIEKELLNELNSESIIGRFGEPSTEYKLPIYSTECKLLLGFWNNC